MSSASFFSIIPARGGSKSLPRKNVLQLGGKPLLAYTIEASLGCPLIQRTIVSTEDAEIKSIALSYGAEVIDRPYFLATDEAQTHDAVDHVLGVLREQGTVPDHIVLLQPTSPLRNSAHLHESVLAYSDSDAKSLVSVTECEHHPYKSVTKDNGHLRPLFDAKSMEMRRQDLPEAYRISGAIYILPTETFLKEKNFIVDPAMAFPMSAEVSIDVDTALDLALVELVLQQR